MVKKATRAAWEQSYDLKSFTILTKTGTTLISKGVYVVVWLLLLLFFVWLVSLVFGWF